MSRPGGFRHVLIFETVTVTNTSGEAVETWTKAFDERAAYEVLGSREFPMASKVHAETTARFRMRAREIDSGQYRIWHKCCDGKRWNMQPPLIDNRTREMTVEASMIKTPESLTP